MLRLRSGLTLILAAVTATLASALLAPPAQAYDISLLAGTVFSRFTYFNAPANLTQKIRPGLSFGAILDLHVAGPFELEPGMIFVLRRDSVTEPTISPTPQLSTLRGFQLPFVARLVPVSWFAFGGGAYYTQGFERITTSANRVSSSEPGYDGTNTARTDYGWLASTQFRFDLSRDLRGIVDFRYLYGLADVDKTGRDSKFFRDFEVMVGLTVGRFR